MNNLHASDETNTEELLPVRKERFDRKSWNMFTFRGVAAWKDDTIPNDEIKVLSPIGRGRFGQVNILSLPRIECKIKVYEAYYYEPAVIKFFDMFHVDEQRRLEVFKHDTACFQNVRHENLVFFRGFYTSERTRMGVVMEYIRGQPLSRIIHQPDCNSGSNLDFNDIIEYSKQICQVNSHHTTSIYKLIFRGCLISIPDIYFTRIFVQGTYLSTNVNLLKSQILAFLTLNDYHIRKGTLIM